MTIEQCDTIIIGGGQAGLSTAYHLTRRGASCVILEDHERVGDIWRRRFDSLRLYSPAKYDGLPGWAFPVPPWTYPSKDQVADYLEAYASRFELPVRTGVRVDTVTQDGDHFVVRVGDQTFEAGNVVVASGTWQDPRTPELAAQLDPSIRQLHSHHYRNPSQLQPGDVLVVGASHSGADIALEVSGGHRTTLAGPVRGELPMDIEGRVARMVLPFLWFAANHVLTRATPVGRKMHPEVLAHGGPLLRVKQAQLAAAGVEHVSEKVTDVQDGLPVLADGRVLDVRNVVWCTGFGKDLSWIQVPFDVQDGWPVQERGVVPSLPGLYFIGLPFLYAFASMLVGGVGRDAERVAEDIVSRGRVAVPA
ncbi:NAD(P)/FAD-dependent oxidoreductase [soil metagenome]